MIIPKWNKHYRTIVGTHDVGDDTLHIRFADGVETVVKKRQVIPHGINVSERDIFWERAWVSGDGMCLRVPTRDGDFEIPWDVMRRLTDPVFAKESAALAAEQARHIGARLRVLRKRQGLTQKRVAEMAGIQTSELSDIEHGRCDLSVSVLWKILAVMGCTAADLAAG